MERMTIDSVTLIWGLFLVQLGLMGAIIAFLYFASKKPRHRHK